MVSTVSIETEARASDAETDDIRATLNKLSLPDGLITDILDFDPLHWRRCRRDEKERLSPSTVPLELRKIASYGSKFADRIRGKEHIKSSLYFAAASGLVPGSPDFEQALADADELRRLMTEAAARADEMAALAKRLGHKSDENKQKPNSVRTGYATLLASLFRKHNAQISDNKKSAFYQVLAVIFEEHAEPDKSGLENQAKEGIARAKRLEAGTPGCVQSLLDALRPKS